MVCRSGSLQGLIGICGVLATVAGCASHVAPAPIIQASPLTGRLTTGVIASLRSIDADLDPALTNSIVTALGQTPVNPAAVSAVEIVIRRTDRTGTSIVEFAQTGAKTYAPGEKIAIVEAATTVIRPE
jgi:hypothetical protein